MLRQLHIRNFALIDQLDMEFHPGFSVVTGETGAGKSIILGAIGLLLGQRADMKAIKQGADKCIVEAHFDLQRMGDGMVRFFEENELDADLPDTIVRRELAASGKSRAFVNDVPVSLAVLKDLGERIIDVHSQHQNLLLGKHDFQLAVVDGVAADQPLLSAYSRAYAQWRQDSRELEALHEQMAQNQQNQDFMKFQHDELTAARLIDGEQEELEARCDTMEHAEDIKQSLFQADNALQAETTGIVGQLRTAAHALHGIERVFADAAELAQRLDTAYIELKDVAAEVSARMDDVDFDPAELESVNSRLDRLYNLQKKYRVESVAQLIAIRDDLGAKLSAIEGGDELLAEKEHAVQQLLSHCMQHGETLRQARTKAARHIEQQMQQRLMALGMPHARFQIDIAPVAQPTANGIDRVAFLFSANTSSALQPVSQVASGGEIARVMLALKAMATSTDGPTIIFDEIDTGVSGKIAEQMALIMAEMGACQQQVISITHLPQIAALGTTHYKVWKEETQQGTTSHMTMLTQQERIAEIAQMLSGSSVSEAAIANAKQLLKLQTAE